MTRSSVLAPSQEGGSPDLSAGPGGTWFPGQAQGSESQGLTTIPPGDEKTSWLTLSLQAAVLLDLVGRGLWQFCQLPAARTLPGPFRDQQTGGGGGGSLPFCP